MSDYPEVAGSAAALIGAAQFVVAGLLTPLAGIGRGSLPWGVVLLIAVGIAAITGAVGLRRVGGGARPNSDSIPGRLDR